MSPEGPVKVADLYFRRNLWLGLFGLFNIYGLLWFGDILTTYASAALLVFPFRRFTAKTLLIFSLTYVSGIAVQNTFGFHHQVVVQKKASAV